MKEVEERKEVNVLVVEDELIIALHLKEILEKSGYNVVGSCDEGERVCDKINSVKPDLVCMDILLSGEMTGIDVHNEMKKQNIDVPVIYITSNSDKATLDKAKATLPIAFIKKPFDDVRIKTTIATSYHTYIKSKEEKDNIIKASDLKDQSIKELSETNAHLITATWRERELKKQLQESLDELQRTKKIVEEQNKKIMESINYSRRIQNAIIPQESEIKETFKDSFIFYKPKDVVSGDFPWFFKHDNVVYYAAVDCTGHGVPGAMMSLIGYLLLNSIVENNVWEPGKILFDLHNHVVNALKQSNPDNNTSDGLDIALIKVDLDTNEVEYSGAHRPLYIIREGELEEIKGSKFPIGGSQYKGLNEYENHKLQLADTDSLYFFSDGLPDQFGGPKNRKFGSKRIKDIILNNHSKPMNEIESVFETEYQTWLGNEKQIDDILLIGLRL